MALKTHLGKIIVILWILAIAIIITNANLGVILKCDERPPYYESSSIMGLSCSYLCNDDYDDHVFLHELENVVVFPPILNPEQKVINYSIMAGFITCFALAAHIPVSIFGLYERKKQLMLFKVFYKHVPSYKSPVSSEHAVQYATKYFLENFQRRTKLSFFDTFGDLMVWTIAALQVTALYRYLLDNYLLLGLPFQIFYDPANVHQTVSCAYPVSLTNEIVTCQVYMGATTTVFFLLIAGHVVFFLVVDLFLLFTSLLKYLAPRTTVLHFPIPKIDSMLGKKLRFADWRELYRISLVLKPEDFQLFLEKIHAKIPDEDKTPRANKPDVIISMEKVNFVQVDKVDKDVLANI